MHRVLLANCNTAAQSHVLAIMLKVGCGRHENSNNHKSKRGASSDCEDSPKAKCHKTANDTKKNDEIA